MNKEKQPVCVYIDKDVYKQFRIQSVFKNQSISQRVNDFMKKEIELKNEH